MNSDIYIKNNLLLNNKNVEFHLDFSLPGVQEEGAKLAWNILHSVLPREVRTGGLLTNIKGLSHNNMIQDGLKKFAVENEDLLFFTEGLRTLEPGEEEDEEHAPEYKENVRYSVNTEFHGFLNRKNIQYKSNIGFESIAADFLNKPVFEPNPKLEIDRIFLGLEFFQANFFSFIGFAPRIKRALLLQTDESTLYLRFKVENIIKVDTFFSEFGEIGDKLIVLLNSMFEVNISAEFLEKAESKQ